MFYFFLEELVLNNLIASPLMDPYFTPGGWHEAKDVGWLVVSVDIQDGILCESFPFKHCGVEKSDFVL